MTTTREWARWAPDDGTALSAAGRALVRQALGLGSDRVPSVPLESVRVPAPTLPSGFVEDATAVTGPEGLRTDHDTRALHARGRSTSDLLLLRRGDLGDVPDAVLLPSSAEEVQALLHLCSDAHVAVVPFGGGSSVVGGLSARRDGFAGVVALDLTRLDRLVRLDPVSQTAELEAGLLGPRAEALLAGHGFTLGHHPQSYEHASIGGFAATRSSGQSSAGHGRFDSMVVGVRVATPIGALDLGSAPASAAGPDLRQLVLGSEGAFGVITSVTVRVRPLPAVRRYEGWRFATFAAGTDAVRELAQSGATPTVLRLSDEAETGIGLATPETVGTSFGSGALLVVGYEGSVTAVEDSRARASALLQRLGALALGEDEGRAWDRGRYAGGSVRDALLDLGALVETLETATFWSGLPGLYDAVRAALAGALPGAIVLCHVSHVYPTGASLYFTVAAKQDDDPVGQWQRAKQAACDAIVRCGATISHHHGVGRDHLPFLAAEIGPVGVQVLRAVKQRLDPAGVLNPGVLVP